MKYLALLSLLAATVYIVYNSCPTSINLYIGGLNGNTTKFLGSTAGFFYTDANGGNSNGAATRAGFNIDQGYYYLVKDTGHFNTGLSIQPRAPQCDTANCTTAYTQPPTRFPTPTWKHKVRLAGTNFCLDAGSSPANGVGMKIWQCYDNLPAQQWYYTGDNRISLENRGQCLDLTNGNLANSNQIQIWQCTDNNTNQIWAL
ncbi:ricin B lectin domain-containing protein [Cyathus striatus]|nr:ricin B lectin domain-containing protein [Cyathus striatus]